MKTAVITDEISQDLAEAAKVAFDYGLDAIELRSVWDKQPHELTDGEIERIQEICSKYNLEVCAISSPFYKCGFYEEEIGKQMFLLNKTIIVAKKLGCQIIRGFSFWQEGDFETELPRLAGAYAKPAQMLQEAGIVLALEPDPSVYACNGERVARLVEAVDLPCVRVLWDAGNDLYSPVPERPFPEGYRHVKPYLAHVHLKDAVKNKDGAHSVKVGTGEVNWPAQLAELRADGYEGYISLETHYRKESVISEELLRQPGGSAFSQNGREASEESIEALLELLAELDRNSQRVYS